MNKNNHWCEVCRAPIKSNPHNHCSSCAAPPEALVSWPDACNRWGM